MSTTNVSQPTEKPAEPVLTGSCGCRAVLFEITEPLVGAIYCHCMRCQKRTGTAYQTSARVVFGSVHVTAGAEHLADWTPGHIAMTFCRLCGSHLFGRSPETGEIRAVRMAAVDGDPGVRPYAHQFVAYAPSWSSVPDDGLPRYPERMPNF